MTFPRSVIKGISFMPVPTHGYWLIHLTHWGWVTHICIVNLTIIISDNGLSPGRRQAIIWTNVGRLLIGPLGTNFSEILIVIQTFSFMKMHLKLSSVKWHPFCLGLNVLTHCPLGYVDVISDVSWYIKLVVPWEIFHTQLNILIIQENTTLE